MELNSSTHVLQKPELDSKGSILGVGDEGIVYNYDDQYAIKIFTRYKYDDYRSKLDRKLAKVQKLISLSDPGVAYPLGFVSSDGKEVDGYFTRLIKGKNGLESFTDLRELKDLRKKVLLLKRGEEVLKRVHKQDIALGDIKGSNILIDKDENPVFVDIDNCKYKNMLFDLIPDRAGCLYSIFQGPLSFQDNDKLLYAMMSLNILTGDMRFDFPTHKDGIYEALRQLDMDKETREVLESIFSDSVNKPYVGSVLEKIKR